LRRKGSNSWITMALIPRTDTMRNLQLCKMQWIPIKKIYQILLTQNIQQRKIEHFLETLEQRWKVYWKIQRDNLIMRITRLLLIERWNWSESKSEMNSTLVFLNKLLKLPKKLLKSKMLSKTPSKLRNSNLITIGMKRVLKLQSKHLP
jgi:hypothetical protein